MAGGANKPAGGGKKTTPAKAVAKAPAALFATKALQAAALKELSGKAGNVDEVRGALIAAAGMSRGLWITFLSLATYLVIAVGAVTHRDLFLENPVRLPLLNVDLPLIAFFWVAPILFLIFHAYLLLHLKLLVDKVRRYSALVAGVGLSDQQEDAVRLQLPNFVFVQLLAAPRDARKGLIGWFLRAIAWITVVVGPIVLLLLIQLQFLPYHHAGVTWIQRIVIVADLILLWLFWPRILMAPDGADAARRLPWRILGSATIVIVGSFSWLLATFPGESADRPRLTAKSGYIGKDGALISVDERLVRPAKKWLFEGKVNEVSGRRESFFSNTLVLPNQDFVDDNTLAEIVSREQKLKSRPWQGERLLSLRGRDLRGAILVRADLRRADFTGVQLQGAQLYGAQLDGATFDCAGLGTQSDENTDRCAQLYGASLEWAELRGASFFGAQLQGVSLENAVLQSAHLNGAQLQGALLPQYSASGRIAHHDKPSRRVAGICATSGRVS